MIELSFNKDLDIDSQDALDAPATKTITQVRSVRELHKVTIEDGMVSAGRQRAHTTAYLALEAGLEWSLLDQTWLGAWKQMRDRWEFLDGLRTQWYAQPALLATADANIMETVALGVLEEAQMVTDQRLVRKNVSLENAWFARPKTGTPQQLRDGRIYFDHPPTTTEYDTTVDEQAAKWEPNLGGMYLAALITNIETWLKVRSLLPWTSVDADSYESGEAAAIEALNKAINAVRNNKPTSADTKAMATAMLATFDFFPPTLTATRTATHGAAVAARHVVEHFQYIPPIQPAWRQAIADEFLILWEARTIANIAKISLEARTIANIAKISLGPPPKKLKTNATTAKPTRDTTGLADMLKVWPQVRNDYDHFYTKFWKAITWS